MQEQIYDRLRTVIDPETKINIVDMGFIYDVQILDHDQSDPDSPFIKIIYTLTTPGCPLASVLQRMIWESLSDLPINIENFDPQQHVLLELIFDPPWTLEHMSAEAKAELGF